MDSRPSHHAGNAGASEFAARAGEVFSLAGELGREFENEHRQSVVAPREWRQHAAKFDSLCAAVVSLRPQIEHPPQGFERVVEVLRQAGRIAKTMRDSHHSAASRDWHDYIEFFPALNSVAQHGWQELQAVRASHDPLAFVDDVPTAANEAESKSKRSAERGEGRIKLIAALTRHHQYADNGCLNCEPIGNNDLARLAGVSRATASAMFDEEFAGHAKYRALCRDAQRLAAALKALNGEFRPRHFYGARRADEARDE